MAEVGRLRLRDDQLVVEGVGGRIIARIEPDDHMNISTGDGRFGSYLYSWGGGQTMISVAWQQALDEGRDYIDVEAVEVKPAPPPAPAIGAGDGEG